MTSSQEDKYWYNLVTGEVEKGMLSPSVNRAGPFDSAEEAARAPELMRSNSERWGEEDAAERE